jgi:L-asparaginase II
VSRIADLAIRRSERSRDQQYLIATLANAYDRRSFQFLPGESGLRLFSASDRVGILPPPDCDMKNELPLLAPVLAEVKRGPIVEARHRGAVVAVEPDGRIVAGVGDFEVVTSTRSTIKPIQALPLITSGAADRFKMTPVELAVCCASHQGEQIHTETVAGLLARIGLNESALMCGSHLPYSEEEVRRLERSGLTASQLHNNCSGKHTGMLATAVHLGKSLSDYVSADHPIQREIIKTFARMAGLEEHLPTAIDGCSAPTFGVPLKSIALAFARLANPAGTDVMDSSTRSASERLVTAMIAHPEMVGGTTGRFDTDLLRASHGKLICKVGAEAVYSVGVLASNRYPRGLGIALKVEDGSYRGMGPAVIETLAQLGVLEEPELEELASYHHPKIDNRRGLVCGEVKPNFELRISNCGFI